MERLRQYTGRCPRIDDPLKRAAYIRDVAISARFYPRGTADWDQKDTQIVLDEDTAEYLYGSYTPLAISYQPGSRPVLERLAQRIVKPEMSERERVFAILKYCHDGFRADYPNIRPAEAKYLNATEEEILKLGGGQCEDRARLIICLCQVAGIPARFVASYMHFLPENGYTDRSGHAMLEIYLEGGWAYFDSTADFYCLTGDGSIASLWELLQHPELVENQSEAVYKDCGKTKEEFLDYRDTFFSERSVITLTNYYVWDGWRYDWQWVRYRRDPNGEDAVKLREFTEELRVRVLTEIGVSRDKIK